ncbi:MAG: DMT family transporter [Candidatus Gallimonas sp.]
MTDKSIGIILIIGAALCFALMNLFVNMAGDLPTMQKVFFRNLIAAIVVFFLLLRSKEKFRIHDKSCLLWLFLRSLIGFIGVVLNFYAIDRLNISDASILNKLSPFFAILFSVFLLRERPTAVEIAFVCITFGGAMFVVKPSFSMEAIPAVAGFFGGACAGFAYTCVRILGGKGERSNMTVFFFSAFSTVASLPFMIAFYKPMSPWQLICLLLAGLSATGGQFFITAAYRKAPAKEIAVFDYSQVLFAALFGFLFLDQLPDLWSVIGYIIIIGTAIAKWLYHLKRSERTDNASVSDRAVSPDAPSDPPRTEESPEETQTVPPDSSAETTEERCQSEERNGDCNGK